MDFSNSELAPFVLHNVRLTGTRIGAGAYGSVEEVSIPGAVCAAKKIHRLFYDSTQVSAAAIRLATAQFARECRLMSTLRHPHIVQFLGVCFFPDSQLPALVMERLLTSLHDLLDPETVPPTAQPDSAKPFFPLSLKSSILDNVGCGLAYLHERSPPIIHRDLSARNVLLSAGMVAKIADLGVARIVPHARMRAAATMTKAPGANVYMPPEALEDRPGDEQDESEEGTKSKYDASIDIFSFGVVSIFMLCQSFPCKLLAPNYREGGRLLGRTELERREHYMRTIYGQLRENHPLLQIIEGCLDFPENRPTICEVLHLMQQTRAEDRDEQADMHKLELLQALHDAQLRNQGFCEAELQAQLQSRNQEFAELQQDLQASEREKNEVEQHLMRCRADLRKAEDTVMIERGMRQRETALVQVKDIAKRRLEQKVIQLTDEALKAQQELERKETELAVVQQHLDQKEKELAEVRDRATEQLKQKESEVTEAKSKAVKQKEEQLRSGEALVALLRKRLQQRDSELDALRKKVVEEAKVMKQHDLELKARTFQPRHSNSEQGIQSAPRVVSERGIQSVPRVVSERGIQSVPRVVSEQGIQSVPRVVSEQGIQSVPRVMEQPLFTQPSASKRSQPKQRDTEMKAQKPKITHCQPCTSEQKAEKQTSTRVSMPINSNSQIPPLKRKLLSVQCRLKDSPPCSMDRGSASTDGRFAYFTPAQTNFVYRYEWRSENWAQLPSCPYFDSALVVIKGCLTAVGGVDGSRTGKLFTLQDNKWFEKYPPMNAVRFCSAVVSTPDGEYVIVIGGVGGSGSWTTSVKLLHVKTRRWYELTDMPKPLSLPSATVCGSWLYVISGEIGDFTGYSCSLKALLSSAQPLTPQSIPRLISWTPLPCSLPVEFSTLATLSGELLIVGGSRKPSTSVNSIHQLVGGEWVEVGSMLGSRWLCLAVSPAPDTLVIVGGKESVYMELNTVEECVPIS